MSVGYAYLREKLGLSAFPPRRTAEVMPVQRVTRLGSQMAIPGKVAPETDAPVAHLLFALKHEDLELAILMEALRKIPGSEVLAAVQATPGGIYTRQLGYFWEKANDTTLDGAPAATGALFNVFDAKRFLTLPGESSPRWRVQWNGLGTPAWCTTVERTPAITKMMNSDLLNRIKVYADELTGTVRDRALSWAYLGETRSSYAIEHETPSEEKQHAFIALLHAAHKKQVITENYLVDLQQATVTNPLDRASAFRNEQNYLSGPLPGAQGVTYIPPPPGVVRELMVPMMTFANEAPKSMDPIVAGAVSSFGFVFLHPFMDGNGRLSRFLIHQSLCQSGALENGLILPISMAMKKHESDYLEALQSFSLPARERWSVTWFEGDKYQFDYRGSDQYEFYRYWDATPAVDFCYRMAEQALDVELREGIEYLEQYDFITREFNRKMDIKGSTLSTLVRGALDQGGSLSRRRRDQFRDSVPEEAFALIEALAKEALAGPITEPTSPEADLGNEE